MDILGTLAMIASLIIVMVGFPSQIIENFNRKSCEGVAPNLIYSACLGYSLWALYGWAKPDWFLAISQTPGCVLSFILLFQIFYYRRNKNDKSA